MFIIRKEGLTTVDLIRSVKYLSYDRDVMAKHSFAFNDVENGFENKDDHLLEKALGVKPEEYALHNVDEIPILAEKLAQKTDAPLVVSVINVKQSIGNEYLNEISKEIQTKLIAQGSVPTYIMAFAGKLAPAQ